MATKTELYSFIERKRDEAVQVIKNKMKEQYNSNIMALIANEEFKTKIETLVSCYETVIEIEKEIDEQIGSKSDSYEGEYRYFRFSLNSKDYVRSMYGNLDAVFTLAEAFWATTKEYSQWIDLRYQLINEVKTEYNTILSNLKIMTAKKGLDYLAELGFNVSCLEDNEKPCNVAVPVNTKKLLLDQIQKPVEESKTR